MVSPSQANTRQRRSLRLRDYDYTQAGAYFLTICTHQRSSWFGHIENDAMMLNEFGEIVREEWLLSGDIRAEIELGDYVIMPNHLHGIVWIVANEDQGIKATDPVRATGHLGLNNVVRATGRSPVRAHAFTSIPVRMTDHPGLNDVVGATGHPGSDDVVRATGRSPVPASAPIPTGPPPKSIGAFVAGFKSAATKRINQIRQTPAAPVWQRNYYEHVIRNEADYQRIAEYIDQNPQRWAMDSLNPINAPQS